MNIWGKILKFYGWTVSITVPYKEKCVICVAPHTSNWDFLVALAAYKSLGREANFLMKKFWFFFPLKYLLYALGGIPVDRKKKKGSGSLTEKVIKLFKEREYVNLALTPEGTRSRREEWKTGFLYMARGANVPIQLGVIDYKNKIVMIHDEFIPTGDVDADMQTVKEYYRNHAAAAKYPENFAL